VARGDSIIRVSIIGDAKKLVGSLKEADKATGGLLKSSAVGIGGTLLALGAVREGFDFLNDSTKEADRLGDALTRLRIQLGPNFTDQLSKTAEGFVDIGASKQDILELEANFADLGTTIGLTNDDIAATAPNVAAVATAISLLEDVDPSAVIEQIGRAANGSAKAALALGVSLVDTKDPAVQLANILDQLKPKLDSVTTGSKDLEQQQRTLDAQVETLQANLGGPLSDALAEVLGWINNIVADIPQLITDFQNFFGVIGQGLSPLARMVDILGQVADGLTHLDSSPTFHVSTGRTPRSGSGTPTADRQISAAVQRERERNGLGQ